MKKTLTNILCQLMAAALCLTCICSDGMQPVVDKIVESVSAAYYSDRTAYAKSDEPSEETAVKTPPVTLPPMQYGASVPIQSSYVTYMGTGYYDSNMEMYVTLQVSSIVYVDSILEVSNEQLYYSDDSEFSTDGISVHNAYGKDVTDYTTITFKSTPAEVYNGTPGEYKVEYTIKYNGMEVSSTMPVKIFLRGDVTLDGVVDLQDVIEIHKYLLSNIYNDDNYFTEEQKFIGDVNLDGRLDVRDLATISKSIMNDIDLDAIDVPYNENIASNEMGLKLGSVNASPGVSVSLPINIVNSSSSCGCVAVVECDKTFTISEISRSICYTGNGSSKAAFMMASGTAFNGEIGNIILDIPADTAHGEYPVNITVLQFDENGKNITNAVGVSGYVIVGDLTYEKFDDDWDGTYDCIHIVGCDKSIVSADIPNKIDGLPVTKIISGVFSDCTSLKSITIPDGVTYIGDSTFYNCTNLTSVTIPDGVTSIESKAFYNCSKLTNVTIPDSLTSIGDSAFYNCTNLTSVTIPDSVTSIGDRAFENCESLTDITILNPDCEIGERCISNWYKSFPVYDGTIYGYNKSSAQAYAKMYNCTFKVIDENIESATGLVRLKKYLVGLADDITDNYDLNSDGSIDVFDIVLLRMRILNA